MKSLLLLALFGGLLQYSAMADVQTLVQFDPTAASPHQPLQAAPQGDLPLALPSSLVIGEGNRIEIVSLPNGGSKALLIEKGMGSGRASFSFAWASGAIPPTGVFTLHASLRPGGQVEESGNFTISMHTGEERLLTLQIGRTGALQLILPDEAEPLRAGLLGPYTGEFHTVTLQLDYSAKEIRLLIDGKPTLQPVPLPYEQMPTSVAFATSTVAESSRKLEFREITLSHELIAP